MGTETIYCCWGTDGWPDGRVGGDGYGGKKVCGWAIIFLGGIIYGSSLGVAIRCTASRVWGKHIVMDQIGYGHSRCIILKTDELRG